MTTTSMAIATGVNAPQVPSFAFSYRSLMPAGSPATIPVKMMSDMPLPMPRSVICSPSHMMKAVPVVNVSTHRKRNRSDDMVTMVAPVELFVSVSAMANDCTIASSTVTYRVHCVILRRPTSPSVCSLDIGS